MTLGRVAGGGTAWRVLSVLVMQLTFALVTFLVAAYTSPTAFALWGVAGVVLNAQYLVRLGLGDALVAVVERERVRDALETALAVTAVLAAALSVSVFVSASWLAGQFGTGFDHDDLVLALRAASIALFFGSLESIPVGLLERTLAFKERALAELATTCLYAVCAIGLLGAGAGVWSLIVARVVLSVARYAAFSLAARVPQRFPRRLDARLAVQLLRYGLPLGMAGIVGFVTTNVDTVLAGRAGGASGLGAYALAFSIATLVPTFLANTVGRVFFAVYASLVRDGNPSTSDAFSAAVHVHFAVVLPATVGLAAFGGASLTEVFGERWSLAADLLPILALYAAAQASGTVLTTLLAARGRSLPQLAGQVTALVVSVAVAIPLLGRGTAGVAWAFTAGQATFFLVATVAVARFWPDALFARLRAPLMATIPSGALGALCLRTLPDSVNATAALVVFGLVYCGSLLALDRQARGLLAGLIRDAETRIRPSTER